MSVKLRSVLILSTIMMVLISETTTSEYRELNREKREDKESESEAPETAAAETTVTDKLEKPQATAKKGKASKEGIPVIQVEDIQRELENLKNINLEKIGPKKPSKIEKMLKEAQASAEKELKNPVIRPD